MPLQIKPSSGSGSITLQATTGTTTNDTLTLPAKTGNIITSADSGTVTQTMLGTGVAGNGPAFSAYLGSNQSLTNNTFTKIQLNTEDFDTNSCYDNSTNYRFTPTVSGYYYVIGVVNFATAASGSAISSLYKNGAEFKRNTIAISSSVFLSAQLNTLIFMNGTTDYIELYGYQSSGSALNASNTYSYFQATMVRSA